MLIYLYTSTVWYRLSLFREISKLTDAKFIILNNYNYDKSDYKDIEYNPDFSDLDIVLLNEEESKFDNLVKFLNQFDFDSLVVPSMNGLKYMILTERLARYYKNKNILYFWEYWPLEDAKSGIKRKTIQTIRNIWVSHVGKYIHHFITPSNYTLAYYISIGIPSNKLVKCPNAMAFKSRKEYNIRSDLGLPKNSKIILYLGRLEKYKGYEELITAFEGLNLENTFLLVCGGKKEEKICRKGSIIFTGSIPKEETYKYYSSADLFILPNNYDKKIEAWGLTVNEAMFYGLPVIVSNATGASFDLVYNGVNGYVVDSDNLIEDLQHYIVKIISDENLQKSMSSNSLKIISNYTFENMAKVFVSAYRNKGGKRG